MKVAISSSGRDLNAQLDPRFGRCSYFLIIDTQDMSFEVFENENAALGGGAGIQAAQFVASKGAKAVLTGNCGPNVMQTFSAAGVQVYVARRIARTSGCRGEPSASNNPQCDWRRRGQTCFAQWHWSCVSEIQLRL